MQNNISPAILFLIIGSVIDLLILIASIFAILQSKKDKIRMWGKWTLTTTLGLVTGFFVGGVAVSKVNNILGLIVAGSVLGFAQWLIIRSYLDNSIYWILATIIGLTGGISLAMVMPELWVLRYLTGMILGATQLLVIRRQYRGAGWLVVASAIGLAYWVLQVDVYVYILSGKGFDWIFFVLVGANTFFYGAITGIALLWLLKKIIQSENESDIAIESIPSMTAPLSSNATPKKSFGKPLLVGIFISVLFCIGLSGFYVLRWPTSPRLSESEAEKIVDSFMKAMVNKDISQASSFYTVDMPQEYVKGMLEPLVTGPEFIFMIGYDGYSRTEVQNLIIGPPINAFTPFTDYEPFAKIEGLIFYSDGYSTSFQVTLKFENSEWKIKTLNVGIVPERIEKYTPKNP